jgi:hypothetical protein
LKEKGAKLELIRKLEIWLDDKFMEQKQINTSKISQISKKFSMKNIITPGGTQKTLKLRKKPTFRQTESDHILRRKLMDNML